MSYSQDASSKTQSLSSRFLAIPNKYPKVLLGMAISLSLSTGVYITYDCLSDTHFIEGRKELSVAQMYDQDDLGACSLFAGHFINFGYWDNLDETLISQESRVESERNLYRYVASTLTISPQDTVLEVACGQGIGGSLIFEEFHPDQFHGIDLSEAQIERANRINIDTLKENPKKISFQKGSAEAIPFPSNTFNKILSIEAAQHFNNLQDFATEMHRVLSPGGTCAVASFFGTSESSDIILAKTIPTIRDGIDHATSVHQFAKTLEDAGFENIRIESIGQNVWQGFDQWVSQGDFSNSWTRNWLKGYQSGLIDYFVVTASKKSE